MSQAGHPCPSCGATTRVYDTERRSEGTLRRRICPACGRKFQTLERGARRLTGFIQE